MTDLSSNVSLRDYFAARAMQTYIGYTEHSPIKRFTMQVIAIWSYQLADAMLAEREKPRD